MVACESDRYDRGHDLHAYDRDAQWGDRVHVDRHDHVNVSAWRRARNDVFVSAAQLSCFAGLMNRQAAKLEGQA